MRLAGARAAPIESDQAGAAPYPSDSQTRNIRLNVSRPGVAGILHGNGTKMMLPLQARDLALQLLACENAAGKT
jgi:hypothetical protein